MGNKLIGSDFKSSITSIKKEKSKKFFLDITIDTSFDTKKNNEINSNQQFNLFLELRKNRGYVLLFVLLVGVSYLSYYVNYITSYFVMDLWSIIPSWSQTILKSTIHFFSSIIRYIFNNFITRMSIFIEFLLVYMFIHRIIGYGVGWYLRKKLDPERIGKFDFHIEWISFRIGMDVNMIVIHGFEWRNPPGFKHTPYLLKINEISIIIDMLSVYKALVSDSSIHIKDINISKINIHLEKYDDTCTTTTVVIDDDQSDDSDFILQEEVVDDVFDFIYSYVTTTKATSNKSNKNNKCSIKDSIKDINLKIGLLNLSAALGATTTDEQTSLMYDINKKLAGVFDAALGLLSKVSDAAKKLNPISVISNATSVIKHSMTDIIYPKVDIFKDLELTNKTDAEIMQKFLELDEDKSGFLDSDELAKLCTALGATLTDEQMEKALSILDADNDGQITYEEFLEWWKAKNKHDYKKSMFKSSTKKMKSALLGIPYTFIIDHLHFDHLDVDAQDILNTIHTKSSNYTAIKLKLFHMFKVDLTLPPDNIKKIKKGEKKQRRGIFLDDVLWKVINKVVTELLYYNSVSMMMLISFAMANNTTTAVNSIRNIGISTVKNVPQFISKIKVARKTNLKK